MNSVVFETRLTRIMGQNRLGSPQRRKPAGKIDSPRLSRYKTTPKVFKRKHVLKKGRNYSISLLVDASGSMKHESGGGRSRKAEIAIKSALKVAASLEKIEGVEYEIACFNAGEVVLKPFGQSMNNPAFSPKEIEDLYNEAFHFYYNTGLNYKTGEIMQTVRGVEGPELEERFHTARGDEDNCDAFFVNKAIERLLPRPGKKVLIVFSDGAPNTECWGAMHRARDSHASTKWKLFGSHRAWKLFKDCLGDDSKSLKKAIQMGAKEGVDVFGIGVIDKSVKYFYPHYEIVADLDQLYPTLLKGLSRLIKKE